MEPSPNEGVHLLPSKVFYCLFVLQFFTADGSKISVRPSGTEPKIKFYFGVKEELNNLGNYNKVKENLENKIDAIKKDLGI